MRKTADVFEDHLELRLAGKVDDDIAKNYCDDVVMLSYSERSHRHAGARRCAVERARLRRDGEFEIVVKQLHCDYAYLHWRAPSKEARVCHGADSFLVRDGKIVIQSVYYAVEPA